MSPPDTLFSRSSILYERILDAEGAYEEELGGVCPMTQIYYTSVRLNVTSCYRTYSLNVFSTNSPKDGFVRKVVMRSSGQVTTNLLVFAASIPSASARLRFLLATAQSWLQRSWNVPCPLETRLLAEAPQVAGCCNRPHSQRSVTTALQGSSSRHAEGA